MEFDIAFVSWVKVLLDLLNLSNFLLMDPVRAKIKIICFRFQMVKMIEFEEKFLGDLSLF